MAPLLFEESIVFPFDDILLRNRISDGPEKNPTKVSDKNKAKIKVETEDDNGNPEDVLNRSVHLCNRCWATFMGIDAYFAHRNEGCQHSQVFIEGVDKSSKELDLINTKSQDTNTQNTNTAANNGILSSKDIKQELLGSDEVHTLQNSTNDNQTEEDRVDSSVTIHSKHNQTPNIDSQDKSSIIVETFYINPNFSPAQENIQRSYGYDKQQSEKVSQTQQNKEEFRYSKKRTMNVLSPDQLSNSLSTQPIKKIKMSESSKELSRELAKILRKQMSNLNNESQQNSISVSNSTSLENESMRVKFSESIKLSESMKSSKDLDALLQKHSEDFNQENKMTTFDFSDTTTLSKCKKDKDSENFNLVQKSINKVSFHNKYSEAFRARCDISNKHIRNKNKSSEVKQADSDENFIKPLREKYVSKSTSQYTDTKSKCFEWIRKNERFHKAIDPPLKRISKFKSNTLVMYNLNINTRNEWLRTIFQRYGNVRDLNIKRYMHLNRAKGVVEFERLSDAEKAYQLCHNRVIDGSRIKLHFYHYSLNSAPNRIASNNTEFGKDYEARFTGKPVRYHCDRDQRPGPYNSLQNPVRNHYDRDQRPAPYNLFS